MSPLEELKDRIKAAMGELDCVIGWQPGFDALHNTPLFMKTPEDVDKLRWSALNVHNPAVYLPTLKGKKIGIVVKGCDSRSVVELIQEKLLERDKVVIFGMPCRGVIDLAKVKAAMEAAGAEVGQVAAVAEDGDTLTVTAGDKTLRLALADVANEKCRRCQYPNAVLSDVFVGEALPPTAPETPVAPDLAALDAMSLSDRMAYWRAHMDRCIRCYACRNACPMCVCRDHCIAQSRDPHWLSQEDTVTEKLMFQIVHAMHLAGRCTECGECERACPMDIPVVALKRHLNRVIHDLFTYQAGTDPQAVPPLLSFKVEEENINERGW